MTTEVGDEESFASFVAARQSSLLRTAWMLTGDWWSAEDLVQLALVKTLPHWRRISREGRPEAYVQRAMTNTYLSWWRRVQRLREEPVSDLEEGAVDDRGYAAAEARGELRALLSRLPPRQRAVVVLRYYSDLSEEETAEVLGCSVGTVKSQASKGLRVLRLAVTMPSSDERAQDERRG